MKIFDHIEQSDASAIALSKPCTYIKISNDDSTNDMTFNLDGENNLTDPITVVHGTTYEGYFYAFENITIVNGDSCSIRVSVGR
jgi:hypothetical protein